MRSTVPCAVSTRETLVTLVCLSRLSEVTRADVAAVALRWLAAASDRPGNLVGDRESWLGPTRSPVHQHEVSVRAADNRFCGCAAGVWAYPCRDPVVVVAGHLGGHRGGRALPAVLELFRQSSGGSAPNISPSGDDEMSVNPCNTPHSSRRQTSADVRPWPAP